MSHDQPTDACSCRRACSAGASGGVSYLQSVIDTLKDPLSRYPEDEVQTQLNERLGTQFSPRKPLRDIMISGAQQAGLVTGRSVDRLSGVLTCDALHDGIGAVKDSVCCGFM